MIYPMSYNYPPDPLGWKWYVAAVLLMIVFAVPISFVHRIKSSKRQDMFMVLLLVAGTFSALGLRFLMGWYYGV